MKRSEKKEFETLNLLLDELIQREEEKKISEKESDIVDMAKLHHYYETHEEKIRYNETQELLHEQQLEDCYNLQREEYFQKWGNSILYDRTKIEEAEDALRDYVMELDETIYDDDDCIEFYNCVQSAEKGFWELMEKYWNEGYFA